PAVPDSALRPDRVVAHVPEALRTVGGRRLARDRRREVPGDAGLVQPPHESRVVIADERVAFILGGKRPRPAGRMPVNAGAYDGLGAGRVVDHVDRERRGAGEGDGTIDHVTFVMWPAEIEPPDRREIDLLPPAIT